MDEDKKSPEQILMERAAEEREQHIIKLKNIDNEDFTHSFRGISITVRAGAEYVGIEPAVKHLAKHLARKMLSRTKHRELNKLSPKERDRHLWEPDEVEHLMEKMIFEMNETPAEPEKEVSKADVIAELKGLGVEPNVSLSKEELLKQLTKAKA